MDEGEKGTDTEQRLPEAGPRVLRYDNGSRCRWSDLVERLEELGVHLEVGQVCREKVGRPVRFVRPEFLWEEPGPKEEPR